MKQYKSHLLTSACAVAAFGFAFGEVAPAFAQLDEIVVTARKREEAIQNVPVAVTAFDTRFFDDYNTRDLNDLEGFIPNVVIDTVSATPGGASFYIRGIGTQEVEKSFDPAVGLIIDGVYLANSTGTLINTFDFEQVEVLRGPQGTLFGKNTTGGVINVRRSRPTGEFGLKYEMTFGSFGRHDFKAIVNAPVVEDVLSAKVSYSNLNDNGHLENLAVGGNRQGGKEFQSINVGLLFEPTDNLNIYAQFDHIADRGDAGPLQDISQTPAQAAANPVNAAPELTCLLQLAPPPAGTGRGACGPFGSGNDLTNIAQDFINVSDLNLNAYTVEANLELGDFTLTNIFGYRNSDDLVTQDFDALPIPVFSTIRSQQFNQLSNELRIAGELADGLNVVAGAYYFKDYYQLTQRTLFFLPLVSPVPAGTEGGNAAEQDRKSYAVFAQADWNFWEDFTLTLGGRYTWEEKKFVSFPRIPTPGTTYLLGAAARGEEDWAEFTPKAGIDWQATDDLLTYYTFSRGFRSGGFNGRNTVPELIGPYEPEFVNQHEIGIKSDWFDRTVRFNAAAFYTKYDDKQEEIIQPAPPGAGGTGSATVVENASTATLWGLEAEFLWTPPQVEGATFGANVGYLNAEYDSFCADLNGPLIAPTAAQTTCGTVTPIAAGGALRPVDNSDLVLRRTPEWQFGIFGQYEKEIGPGEFDMTVAYRWTDGYVVEASNDPRGFLDSNGLLDAQAGYTYGWAGDNRAKLTVFARNITNEKEPNSAVTIPGLIAFAGITPGRTWGIELSGEF